MHSLWFGGAMVRCTGLINHQLQAKGGGDMSSGGFAARAQSGAAQNTNAGTGQNTGSQKSNGADGAGGKK